ncbi:flagellar hook-basal body protein [Falsibacillus albus]|uniref:Flagellar hook-basal body protein n=1 Tax=Falsibacillus albus TaxID=2478915 RepID=A0A3L7JXB1_9BACI|nr:flagellar hook-basal body protein [Falsibacillus albus]RLQ94759.1 flagellar hook-basal body protein [Falsibacillus albus]
MLRGFYTAASGMIAQQRRTEMLTNNMANANTPGFKADQSSMRAFPEMLLSRIENASIPTEKTLNLMTSNRLDTGKDGTGLNLGVYMQEANPLFSQGDLQSTDRTTDLAIEDINMPMNQDTDRPGSVFFAVQDADGHPRYTRNGNFTIDAKGFLTTSNGLYVLNDQGKPIQLDSDQFTINENGQIAANGKSYGRIGIGYSDNPEMMNKQGDGLFYLDKNAALPSAYDPKKAPNVDFQIKQGFIEGSNVDSSKTMTDLLTAYRAFEANQKVLQAYDKSMDKAVNEVGRVNG